MNLQSRPIETLNVADLEAHPVWEFSKHGETNVHPVTEYPVRSLRFRFVATRVQLANGTTMWATIGNVSPTHLRKTELFLSLSVLRGTWFHLSRYFDFDYGEHGPQQLASFLGLSVDEVFPISYDITDCVIGDPGVLVGKIPREPRQKLSKQEIFEMTVDSPE